MHISYKLCNSLCLPMLLFFCAERYSTGNTSQESQHSDLLQTRDRVSGFVLKNTPIVITLPVFRSVVPLSLRQYFILIKELFPFTQIPVYSNYRICSRNLPTFFSILVAEKSGYVKYANFFCGGLDLGFILV